jgi:hypothetical protein
MRRSVIRAAVLLAACSGGNNFSLSARTAAQSSGTTPSASGIALTRVRLALRKVELRSRTDDLRVKVTLGPVVLDFAGADLDGRVRRVLDSRVPATTYDRIEFEIEPLERSVDAPGADDLVQQRASGILEGTIDGEPFTFVTRIRAEQEREGKFTVSESSSNVTLDIDTSGWFVKDGVHLDPRDDKNRLAIESNLKASIDAFDDDDSDGHRDRDDGDDDDDRDGGHGGHGDGGHDGGD